MSYAPHHPICDVCGEPKRQTNHWFQIRVSAERIVIEAFDAKSKSVKHFCGEGCVGKFASAALAGLHATETPIEFPILPEQSPAPEVASVCERAKTG